MSDELEKIRKEKMKFEKKVIGEVTEQMDVVPMEFGVAPISEEKAKRKVKEVVAKEFAKIDEKNLYELSLEELNKNPNATEDDLVYMMANSLHESTKSKLLKKVTKKIMKKIKR